MCMVDGCDLEGTFLGSKMRRARVQHTCQDCGRKIEAGEQYMTARWAMEGTVETMKMCLHCDVAAEWLRDNCGGFVYGGVWEDIDEHVYEYRGVYPEVARDLKRLAVWADHDWRVKYGPRAGSMLPVPKTPRFPSDRGAAK
jgi:hypothetical protein